MNKTIHYGEEHIFTSRKGNMNITLKAGVGETLIIDGYTPNASAAAGSNTEVQYNNNGTLGADSNFTFDSTNLLVPNIQTGNIYGGTTTNTLGYNQIYRGTGPQQVTTAFTSVPYPTLLLGRDVCIARSANYAALACSHTDEFDANMAGISMFKETAGTFSEYSSLLTAVTFTVAFTKFAAINDDATLAAVTDCYDTPGNISMYKRVGSTWSWIYNITNQYACKISGDNLICYDRFSNISVYYRSGDTFLFDMYLSENNLTGDIGIDIPIEIQGDRYIFMLAGIIEVWDYELETGFSRVYLASSAALTFAYCSNVLATLTTSKVKIYENFVLSNEVSLVNPLYVCTNGTYVFVISSTGIITILYKSGGIWVTSYNTTTLATGTRISCNQNYLVVGEPNFGSNGRSSIYGIVAYTNGPSIINTIDTLGASNEIAITAAAGVTISGNVTVGNGTEANPSINFTSSSATGIYSSVPTNIDFVTGGTKRMLVTSGGLVKIASDVDSTSTTIGSLQTLGGLGVAKTIFATTYSSPNGAFKMNSYQASTAQAVAATVAVPILFGTDLLTGISTMTKTTSGGGSRYTTSIACKLLIDWSFRLTGASNFGQTYLLLNGAGKFYGHCNAWAQSGQGNALSSSVIMNLSANDYFTIFVISDQNCNISSDATYQISLLQFYSLN